MDKKKTYLVPAVLYLREISNMLQYELPDISTCLLTLAAKIIATYKIADDEVLSASNIVEEITSSNTKCQELEASEVCLKESIKQNKTT